MIIREIKPNDNEHVYRLIKLCFDEFNLETSGSSLEDDDIKDMYQGFQIDRAVYYVLLDNGQVLGGAGIKQLKDYKSDTCELQKMYFLPEARGKGFGKIIFDMCIRAAKDFKFKYCYLESSSQLKTALALYEKNGFKYLKSSLGNTGHTICGIYMQKELI